jgi:hypothetical protein
MIFVVETRFSYGWENVWTDDDEPSTFATRQEAQASIDDLIANMQDYSPDDYRITELKVAETSA